MYFAVNYSILILIIDALYIMYACVTNAFFN